MDRLLREGNPPAGQLASPKPQYKDVQTNSWEELKGEGGASYVKDKDVFAKLEQARVLLNAISGKDFATQTTLAAVLAKLADLESELATEDKLEQVRQLLSGVATEAKLEQARVLLNTISNKDFATQATLEVVQSELALIKSELANIKANQLSGDQKVQLSGTNTVLLSGFYDSTVHRTFWHRYYWGKEGTIGGNDNVPLDVRGYREIAVRITSNLKRQGDEQTIKYAVYAYTDLISRQGSSHAVDILVPLTELPYGATIYLTADQYPKLADPHLGILVHTVRAVFQANDEGGTTVEIIGRV